jgi:probable phosphoglycerate mutase
MTIDRRAIPLLAQPFYFLRHGQTESNVRGTIAGSLNIPLTARGHAEARAAAVALEGRGVTVIYSSALRRARDTPETIAAALKLPVILIPNLAERNWGVLEGQPRELRAHGMNPLSAETAEEFTGRVLKGLAEVNSGGTPLIVAHSGIFRVLCRAVGMLEPVEPIANARPLRCIPPDGQHSAWHVEIL